MATTERSVHFSSATDECATPQQPFDQLDAEFGGFDLDVCASTVNAKCPRFYTAEEGLPEFPDSEELEGLWRASLERVTPWETAIHEAGHAVAHGAQGGLIGNIFLADDPQGEVAGQTQISRTSITGGELGPEVIAVTLISGDLAVALALGHDVTSEQAVLDRFWWVAEWDLDIMSTDQQKLATMVDGMDDPEGRLTDWLHTAVRLLTEHWEDVQWFAKQVMVTPRREPVAP